MNQIITGINLDNLNLDVFKKENWINLSIEERKNALINLERAAAETQGRSVCKISFENLGDRCRGTYNPITNEIKLNDVFLKSDNPYQAMRTTLHEGRHSYQNAVVNGKCNLEDNHNKNDAEFVKANKELWKVNNPKNGIYYKGEDGFSRYRYQPIEADANNYADNLMQSFSDRLGNDSNYIKNMSDRDNKNKEHYNNAIEKLNTQNPEQFVAQEVLQNSRGKENGFKNWINPDNYNKDGHYIGNYKPYINSEQEIMASISEIEDTKQNIGHETNQNISEENPNVSANKQEALQPGQTQETLPPDQAQENFKSNQQQEERLNRDDKNSNSKNNDMDYDYYYGYGY